MGPVLNGLIKLQSIETRLRGMKSKLARTQRAATLQENLLRTMTSSLEAKKHEILLTRSQVDKLELELESRDETLQKYRTALNTAKSNKEYAAILTEINLSKADNAKLENQILELMNTIEQEQENCKEIESQITEQTAKVEEVQSTSSAKGEQIQIELDKIQTEWDEAAKDIPKEALASFNKLSDTYDGEALAFIEQADKRRNTYTCSGCYMSLTHETVNQLLTHDEIIHCPSCSRIVVLDESFEQ